jgi:hypothetical protein
MTQRRFPPPWSVEDIGAAFVVKDNVEPMWEHRPKGDHNAYEEI